MLASDVRVLLLGYAPRDPREAAFRDRMLALTDTAHPFERSTFEPGHFTASAFVLSPERNAIAMILHRKLGLWLQPGGHIEPGDGTVLDAARREVQEELGLEELLPASAGLFDVDVHPIPGRPSEPAHEHFDLRVLFVAGTTDLHPSDEVAGARWVPLTEIDGFVKDESVLRAARKLGH